MNCFENTGGGGFNKLTGKTNSLNRLNEIMVLITLPFVFIGFAFIYYYYGDSLMKIIPPCVLYWYCGIKCPVCGAQRAIYHLLHGNIIEAFRLNWLIVVFIFTGFFLYIRLLYSYLIKNERDLKFIAGWICLSVICAIIFTILRNLKHF